MGFFSKLFGGNKAEKPDPTIGLPVKKAALTGSAFFDLEDPGEERELERLRKQRDLSFKRSFDDEELEEYKPTEINADYEAEVEYVILDEALLAEGIQEDPVDVALNEVFYVVIAEHNSITGEVLDGNMEEYEKQLLEELNFAIKDWGLQAKSFKLLSLVPRED